MKYIRDHPVPSRYRYHVRYRSGKNYRGINLKRIEIKAYSHAEAVLKWSDYVYKKTDANPYDDFEEDRELAVAEDELEELPIELEHDSVIKNLVRGCFENDTLWLEADKVTIYL